MAIDPYLPLEEHSAEDLVAEIVRLNRLCFEHEQARERLEFQVAALTASERERAETEEWQGINGFFWGLVCAAVGFFVVSFYIARG